MQKNVIINGNCISEMKTMSSNSIGLIVADPPPCYIGADRTLFQGYHDDEDGKPFETWEEYEKFSYQWLTACKTKWLYLDNGGYEVYSYGWIYYAKNWFLSY